MFYFKRQHISHLTVPVTTSSRPLRGKGQLTKSALLSKTWKKKKNYLSGPVSICSISETLPKVMKATRENLDFLVVDFELISICLKTSGDSLSLLYISTQGYIKFITTGGRLKGIYWTFKNSLQFTKQKRLNKIRGSVIKYFIWKIEKKKNNKCL